MVYVYCDFSLNLDSVTIAVQLVYHQVLFVWVKPQIKVAISIAALVHFFWIR